MISKIKFKKFIKSQFRKIISFFLFLTIFILAFNCHLLPVSVVYSPTGGWEYGNNKKDGSSSPTHGATTPTQKEAQSQTNQTKTSSTEKKLKRTSSNGTNSSRWRRIKPTSSVTIPSLKAKKSQMSTEQIEEIQEFKEKIKELIQNDIFLKMLEVKNEKNLTGRTPEKQAEFNRQLALEIEMIDAIDTEVKLANYLKKNKFISDFVLEKLDDQRQQFYKAALNLVTQDIVKQQNLTNLKQVLEEKWKTINKNNHTLPKKKLSDVQQKTDLGKIECENPDKPTILEVSNAISKRNPDLLMNKVEITISRSMPTTKARVQVVKTNSKYFNSNTISVHYTTAAKTQTQNDETLDQLSTPNSEENNEQQEQQCSMFSEEEINGHNNGQNDSKTITEETNEQLTDEIEDQENQENKQEEHDEENENDEEEGDGSVVDPQSEESNPGKNEPVSDSQTDEVKPVVTPTPEDSAPENKSDEIKTEAKPVENVVEPQPEEVEPGKNEPVSDSQSDEVKTVVDTQPEDSQTENKPEDSTPGKNEPVSDYQSDEVKTVVDTQPEDSQTENKPEDSTPGKNEPVSDSQSDEVKTVVDTQPEDSQTENKPEDSTPGKNEPVSDSQSDEVKTVVDTQPEDSQTENKPEDSTPGKNEPVSDYQSDEVKTVVDTQPEDSQTENKPEDSTPGKNEPVSDSQSDEVKTETKPEDSQTDESKPIETVVESKPEDSAPGNNGGGGGAPQGEQLPKKEKKQLSEIITKKNLGNINFSDINKPTKEEVLTAVKNKNSEVDLNQVEVEFDQNNLNKQATINAKSDSSDYEGSVVVTYITQKDVAIQDGKNDIITGDIPPISTNNSTPRNNNVKTKPTVKNLFIKKYIFGYFL